MAVDIVENHAAIAGSFGTVTAGTPAHDFGFRLGE
jgi:hypothetical protein